MSLVVLYLQRYYSKVSISELGIEFLEVFPNPANGWVNIKYDTPDNISSTIRLISLTGKLIYEIDLEANNRVEQLIPLIDISSGIYCDRGSRDR